MVPGSNVFTPSTQQWSPGPAHPLSAYPRSALLLSTGEFLVLNDSGQGALYNPVKNVWRTATALQSARATFTTVQLPTGQVMVTGGYANSTSLATVERYTR